MQPERQWMRLDVDEKNLHLIWLNLSNFNKINWQKVKYLLQKAVFHTPVLMYSTVDKLKMISGVFGRLRFLKPQIEMVEVNLNGMCRYPAWSAVCSRRYSWWMELVAGFKPEQRTRSVEDPTVVGINPLKLSDRDGLIESLIEFCRHPAGLVWVKTLTEPLQHLDSFDLAGCILSGCSHTIQKL